MNSPRLHSFATALASHPLMGVLGMVAGWMAVPQPSGLAQCTAPHVGTGIIQVASMHLREHAAMYVGMALGNLLSIAVASVVQDKPRRWVREAGSGAKCFIVMSIGMVLGSVATGHQLHTLARWLEITPTSAAMLAGIFFAVLVERLSEGGLHLIRRSVGANADMAEQR